MKSAVRFVRSCEVIMLRWLISKNKVYKDPKNTGIRAFCGQILISGRWSFWSPIWALIACLLIRVPDFSGSGVHVQRKYWYKWLFFQNTHFNRNLSLPFNGVLTATFLQPYFILRKGTKGNRTPASAHQIDHLGEFCHLRAFYRVLSFRTTLIFFWQGCVWIWNKILSKIFLHRIFYHRFFCFN